jgi:hypothetical protein
VATAQAECIESIEKVYKADERSCEKESVRMDARFYNTEDIDIERLANDLTNVYMAQGYQTQQFGNRDQMMVQLKKGGDLEALVGMQAAVSLTLQRTAGGTLAMIGQQRWLDKAAVGTIGIVAFPVLWPLALTAGAGALRQASLGNQVLNMVDNLVRQQRPDVRVGPIPVQIMPQIQQQWGPAPYPPVPTYVPPQSLPAPAPAPAQKLRCSFCNTPYEAGDTFCSGCGRSLTPPKVHCTNCNAELKPGVAFCPQCGTSTFQPSTVASTMAAPATPPPTQAPQTPYYTPPASSGQPAPMPHYTPPAQPVQQPYYTPPATPPATPPVDPHAAPTLAAPPAVPAQPKPETYYVPSKPAVPPPPVTQEPPVQPQPQVTLVPAPQQSSAKVPPKPQPPEKQYYIPSTPPQQDLAQASTVQAPAVQRQPLTARPSTQPSADANAPWGSLSFANGNVVQLAGERAVVGRSDHDLGGNPPEVDLAAMQGADTVSRIHAALEHIGSTYTLTDLNSTNATRINGKRLEPDKATPINDGDTLTFGKVTCTFKRV